MELARGRLIARVRRGLYLIPSRLPVGGSWSPDEVLALNTLIEDRRGRYQICGPNAFNRYGFDDQIPTRVYAYNDRISEDRTIGSISLQIEGVEASLLKRFRERAQGPAGRTGGEFGLLRHLENDQAFEIQAPCRPCGTR